MLLAFLCRPEVHYSRVRAPQVISAVHEDAPKLDMESGFFLSRSVRTLLVRWVGSLWTCRVAAWPHGCICLIGRMRSWSYCVCTCACGAISCRFHVCIYIRISCLDKYRWSKKSAFEMAAKRQNMLGDFLDDCACHIGVRHMTVGNT